MPEQRPDAALRKTICDFVRQGITPMQAALVAGVSESEFSEWLSSVARGDQTSGSCEKLVAELARAEAEAELTVVGRIKLAAKENWQAAAWLAERRWPARYARKSIQGDEAPRGGAGERPPEDPFSELDGAVTSNVTPLRPARGSRSR